MEINSAFSSGISGLNKASEQITESSQSIATQSIDSESSDAGFSDQATSAAISNSSVEPVTAEMINMKLAEVQAQSAAKVITTADDMVGLLIDVSV